LETGLSQDALRKAINISLAQSERGEVMSGPEFMAELLRQHDERFSADIQLDESGSYTR